MCPMMNSTVLRRSGAVFVDIREFYGQESDLQPGKKGISLQKEQVRTQLADSFLGY